MIDRDRFSDEYDPEPDYDRPTAAEARAEEELFAEHPHYAARRPIDDEIEELDAEYDQGAHYAGLRAHLNAVHGIETADIDDIALEATHKEAHGR